MTDNKKSILGSKAKTARTLCLLLALIYFTSYITRLNYSACMAEMINVGVLTKPQAGIIGSALFFTYGFGQIISGALSDKFSPNIIISSGLLITVSCNLIMPSIPNAGLMAVIWGANGFAQALFWPPIVRMMALNLDEKQYAQGNWLVSVASHAATILIYLIVPVFITVSDWKSAFYMAAVWAAICLVVWSVGYMRLKKQISGSFDLTPDKENTELKTEAADAESTGVADRNKRKTGLWGAFAASGTLFIFAAIAMQGYLKDGIQSWMPTFFTEVFDMPSSAAILSNAVLPMFNILVVSIATLLYRKVFRSEVRESLVFFGGAALLCVLLTFFFQTSAVVCLLLAALITGSMHGINLMFISFLPRRFKESGKVATVSGICNAFSYLGSTVSSYGIALVAQGLGWRYTVLSWGGVALAGALLCLLAYRRFHRFV